MKTTTTLALAALALVLLALTPYTASPRQGHSQLTAQTELPPRLGSSQEHPDLSGLVVSDLDHGVTPANLVNALVGSGVTISNVTYTGSARTAGTFTGGTTIVGFNSGIILSCGKVQTITPGDATCSSGVEGPNTCHEVVGGTGGSSNSTNFSLPGDSQLSALAGFGTFDAAVLEFDFVPEFSTVQFQYVFSSEEYSDFANTEFNDVFAFFVNGVNCALVPGTSQPVSINTINNGNDANGDATPHHPELFRDNVRPTVTINTQMDGLTIVLTCTANVTPGVSNHMKLAIADASDGNLDSAVFLKAESLISGTVITTSLTGGSQAGPMITVSPGTVVTDSATLSGSNASVATGTVSYKVFSDPNCAVLFADAGTKTVTNGQLPDSDPVMFNFVGNYYWQASYSGDALNNPSSGGCGEEIVTVIQPTPTPPPATTPTPTPALPPLAVTISLPVATVPTSVTTFTQPVLTSSINAVDNLIGFQGDFTFDSTVVSFQSPPISAAGLTANNWNVAGNVLPGAGPIRTLRVAAFSNDGMTPLSGSGILFTLNMSRVGSVPGASTALTWAAPPDDFQFINNDLDLRAPMSAPPGSITIQSTSIQISGAVSYCHSAVLDPVPNVTLNLTGTSSDSTLSNNSGAYQFSSLTPGSYVVTPTKSGLPPASSGIDTLDAIAVQMHYLNIATLAGTCTLPAADVNGDTLINTYDVIAIQRFFIGRTFGFANVGKYKFSPASRAYPGVNSDQIGENYDALVLGDVVFEFVHRADAQSKSEVSSGATVADSPTAVERVALPEVTNNPFKTDLITPVTTTAIDAKKKLIGFQGDFTFDERVVTFPSEAVQKAGLTGGNWNVSGNVLEGKGPIRTLRISAFSNDFSPLSGSGTLFELKMIRVNRTNQSTQLVWAAPPDNFVFIDANLNVQSPRSMSPGGVGLSGKTDEKR